jgi:hypothetical protein
MPEPRQVKDWRAAVLAIARARILVSWKRWCKRSSGWRLSCKWPKRVGDCAPLWNCIFSLACSSLLTSSS